jgi:hypothetical protein
VNVNWIIAASDSARRLVSRRSDGERISPQGDSSHDESQNGDDRGHNDGELGRDRAAISVVKRVH